MRRDIKDFHPSKSEKRNILNSQVYVLRGQFVVKRTVVCLSQWKHTFCANFNL